MIRKTVNEAKKATAAELVRTGIEYEKLTARTVSFEDLARDGCVFVKIHGLPWKESPISGGSGRPEMVKLKQFARAMGFRIENN